ncbi:MAG TPA: hypothetical protein VMF11_07610 [Candidatus Baltobacteraceae bacterium]|nr:hypothetical protein [Candidatus Baltobacteraceae bacterium]
MTRPHEDLQRHAPTDHRVGGPVVAFAPGSWWAIDVVHVASNREDAAISSYETLIEKARASGTRAREAAVLAAHDHRRVIVLVHLDGHEAFRHLNAAWDDHHLFTERHAVAESHAIALYRLAACSGEGRIDPATHDAYAFEHALIGGEAARAAIDAAAKAPGFRGVCLFTTDDDRASAIVYRFEQREQIDAFRAPGEVFYPVHAVRTFA